MSGKKAFYAAAVTAAFVFCMTLGPPPATGDVFILSDGGRIEGAVESQNRRNVMVQTKYGLVTVRRGDIEEWDEKSSPYDEYVKKKKDLKNTANGHFEMGEWCREKEFDAQAKAHFKEVLKLNPKHEKARERLGIKKITPKTTPKTTPEKKSMKPVVKKDDKVEDKKEEKAKKKKPIVERIKKKKKKKSKGGIPIPFTITASCAWDADNAWLHRFGKHIKAGSEYLFMVTRGQMYVSVVTISDQTPRSECIAENKDGIKTGRGYAWTGAGAMHVGGKVLSYTFAHEFLHLKCGIPDEYTRDSKPACPICIMSADPKAHALCDSKTHKGEPGRDCFSLLRKRFPRIREDYDAEGKECPETKVVIRDK
ncbi:MAG: hypothetical protein E3J72_07830 [Planctomycetota bacterium]|nr:MAG: hypothetical protein E3J72_07830 [Planctomycetota bacterium]